jgi:tight adherence protein C
MILIFLIALLLAGFGVTIAVRALAMPRARTMETVQSIGAYGYSVVQVEESARGGSVRTLLDEIADVIGGIAGKRLGFREDEVRKELITAGLYGLTPRKFMGYRVLSIVCVPLATFWALTSIGAAGPIAILLFLFAVPGGWVAPMRIVKARARTRLEQIDYELPELIDVLVATVEAGLGFNGSLQLAANRLGGPLGQELRLTLQEQSLGLSSNEALRNMLTRCETPAMRSFVRSVLQGETLGVSIGQIMRNLASEMRKRRRASAEERAQRAPVKILFPLIFLIFPAMFVILLGPAVFQFMDAFSGG